jgi:dolichol-phosphate mannosyltransferase
VSAVRAAINCAILSLSVYITGIDYRIANIIGILVGFAWNFLVNQRMTWLRK